MKRWWIPLCCSAGATVLWWVHIVLTWLYWPFRNLVDTSMFVIVTVCKPVVLLSLVLFVLPRLFAHIQSQRRRAVLLFGVWFVPLVGFLLALSLLREPLIMILNNEAIRYYPASAASPELQRFSFAVGLEDHLRLWRSGAVFLHELVALLVAIAAMVTIGYRWGHLSIRAGLAAAIVGSAVVIMFAWVLKLAILDYDVFMSGSLVAPLALDIAIPIVAMDPITEIGLPVFAWLVWSSFLLVRRWQRQAD